MPYVYKYVNRESNDVEYVGISKTQEGFYKRIADHKRDKWYTENKYDVYYFEVDSQTDAESLEGHFIALYRSYEFHNKAKARWGKCSFAPSVEWIKYEGEYNISSRRALDKRVKELQGEVFSLDCDLLQINKSIKETIDAISDLEVEVGKARRETIRQWFRDSLGISYTYGEKTYKADKSFLFGMFNEWLEENSPPWDFDDENDFWDAMCDVPELSRHIHGDEIFSLITKRQMEEQGRKAADTLANLFDIPTKNPIKNAECKP